MKQIFLLENGILTYLVFAATADGKKVYVTDSVYNIVSVMDTATNTCYCHDNPIMDNPVQPL